MPDFTTSDGLVVRGLSPRHGALTVAWDVDLDTQPGEVVALLGPNGAGKTSIVDCIAGLVAGAGEVHVAGQRLDGMPAHRRARHRLAVVPEDRGLFGDLSVLDNLLLGREISAGRGLSLDEVLSLFPVLGDRRQQHAGTLSGGEQQMLAVARAILADPVALIIDEPTQGLAPKIYDTLIHALGRLKQTGMAVLLVEQNVGFAAAIADRYLVMSGGRIVETGTSDRLTDGERLFEQFIAG
jgi:branched-chain amino acid transport system ATP-binding protein